MFILCQLLIANLAFVEVEIVWNPFEIHVISCCIRLQQKASVTRATNINYIKVLNSWIILFHHSQYYLIDIYICIYHSCTKHMLNILLIILIILFFDMLYWCNPLWHWHFHGSHFLSTVGLDLLRRISYSGRNSCHPHGRTSETSRQVSVDHNKAGISPRTNVGHVMKTKKAGNQTYIYIYRIYIDDTKKYGRWMALITSNNCGFMWFHRSTRRNGGRSSLTSPRRMV